MAGAILEQRFKGTVAKWKSDCTDNSTSDSDTGIGGNITYPDDIVTRCESIGTAGRALKKIVFRVPAGAYAELSVKARKISGVTANVYSESFRIYPNTGAVIGSILPVSSTDWLEYKVGIIAPQFTQNYAELSLGVGFFKNDAVGVVEFKLPVMRVWGVDGSISIVEGEIQGDNSAYCNLRLESNAVIIDDDFDRYFSRGVESVAIENDGSNDYIELTYANTPSVRRPIVQVQSIAFEAGLIHDVKANQFSGSGVVRIYVFDAVGAIVSDLSTVADRLDISVKIMGAQAM